MAKIHKVSFYLPKKEIKNSDLENEFPDCGLEKSASKIGVKSRRVAEFSETAVDLGIKAGDKVLKGFDKNKIDFLIFCTQSPDYFLPTSSCIIQDRLKLNKVPSYDFNLGCSGYVYGLAMAESFVNSGMAKNVLLITSETYSKHIHPKDKANRIIFGDGASATIITIGHGIGKFKLGSDGSGFNKLIVPNGGFRNQRISDVELKEYGNGNKYDDNHIHMDGSEVFNFTINTVPSLVKDTLSLNDINFCDINLFVFHQANRFMLNYLRTKIGIPKEKFYINMEEKGNTVSSTIPICLSEAMKDGYINKGDKVMLVGFGVGLSWGATIVKF